MGRVGREGKLESIIQKTSRKQHVQRKAGTDGLDDDEFTRAGMNSEGENELIFV